MSDDRKKSIWPWIVALLIGLPLLYVVSFGPACWINQRWDVGTRSLSTIYHPVLALASEDGQLPQPMFWYAKIGTRDDDVPVVQGASLLWREQMIRDWNRRVASQMKIHLGPTPRHPPREIAPEEIRWVDPVRKRVWIGLGDEDCVEPGMVFRVRKGPPPWRAADNPHADHADEGIVGRIEVTHVIEIHLSEARILEQDHDRPIAKGDSVLP